MYLNGYELSWFKLGVMIDTSEPYSLISGLSDVDLDSKSHRYEKAKTAPVIRQSSRLIVMELGMQLRPVGLMNLIQFVWWTSFSFYLVSQYSREKTVSGFLAKLWLAFRCLQISFKLGMKLSCILWYYFEWPSFKVTVVWESRIFCSCFLTNVSIDLD